MNDCASEHMEPNEFDAGKWWSLIAWAKETVDMYEMVK